MCEEILMVLNIVAELKTLVSHLNVQIHSAYAH